MKDDCFEVVVEFTGWAALHVAERTWSPDQKIKRLTMIKSGLNFPPHRSGIDRLDIVLRRRCAGDRAGLAGGRNYK